MTPPHGVETSTMTPVHIPVHIFTLAGDTFPPPLGVSRGSTWMWG